MRPELTTARLAVRMPRPAMAGAMARFMSENYHSHLERWLPPMSPAMFTEAFWAERFALAEEELAGDRAARFVLQPAGGPEGPILGTANYTNFVRGAFHACHLGYQIGREHEGQGLMAEALRASNAFVFGTLRMHRIMANFRPENDRSRQLARRLGFVEEGLARDYLFIDGAWRDHVLSSLVNPRFDDAWVRPR